MDAPIPGYGEEADRLADRYESVDFADIHRDALPFFPTAPSRVLDVGAGSGRDAAALARLGHRVTAVEPTPELLAHAERLHPGLGIEWLDDSLPDLAALRARPDRYDLVLLSAVWMHLDPAQRAAGMASLAGLLAPAGQIFLSLRHGPVPPGRRMYEVTGEETIALAGEHGLRPLLLTERADDAGLHRPDVTWTQVGLRGGA